MEQNQDFASVHAYLCADGYVIRNQEIGKKYYYVGLRNMNIVLLKDFQKKCRNVFGINPIITRQKDRCKFQNKEICLKLLADFGSFHSHKWSMPKMSRKELSSWLRSYFDCDGWASLVKAKDRKIGLDSVNYIGLKNIQKSLKPFGITSSVHPRKARSIWNLSICGKDDLIKFRDEIGFLHPNKKRKLEEAIGSYMDYNWKVPEDKYKLTKFLKEKGRKNLQRKEIRFNSIIKFNLEDLHSKLSKYKVESRLNGPWKNPYGSKWYCLSINLRELNKLRGGES